MTTPIAELRSQDEVLVDGNRIQCRFVLEDPVVASFLLEETIEDRASAVRSSIRVGADVLRRAKAASTELGVEALRDTVTASLDRLTTGVDAATSELRQTVASQSEALDRQRRNSTNQLASTVRDAGERINEILAAKTADRAVADALAQQVREVLTDATVQLSRQNDVALGTQTAALQQTMNAVSTAQERLSAIAGHVEGTGGTPQAGLKFESSIENQLVALCEKSDVLDHVGTRAGANGSKVGDFTIDLEGGRARLVIEAKNTVNGQSPKKMNALIADGHLARSAHSFLLVARTDMAMPTGLKGASLGLVGDSGVAVVFDPATATTPALLETALRIARTIALVNAAAAATPGEEASIDLDRAKELLESIASRVGTLSTIERNLRNLAKTATQQQDEIASIRKQSVTEIAALVSVLDL